METVIGGGMFILGKQIGGGSFGTVYEGISLWGLKTKLCSLGEWREQSKKVAIKMEPRKNDHLKHEYLLLQSLQHTSKILFGLIIFVKLVSLKYFGMVEKTKRTYWWWSC